MMRSPVLVMLVLIVGALGFLVGVSAPSSPIVVEVFTRAGCPRCSAAEEFLQELAQERPSLRVVERRVDRDPEALRALEDRARSAGIASPGVPLFVIRDAVLIGFDSRDTSGQRIRALLDGENPDTTPGATCLPDAETSCPPVAEPKADTIETAVGKLSVSRLGLPLFTLAVGLLDGFNPCAMWVLVFLLSMLASLHDRRRMGLIAGTFVVTSGVVYYAFMAAWLNIFLLIGMSRRIEIALGLIALLVSILNIKDFFAFKRGPSLSIPDSKKPRIYARVRAVVRANRLAASMAAVVGLAVLVNFVELLCTAGFPALYTAILTRQGLPGWQHYAYLGLYNLAYIADDGVMVSLAVATLSRRKLTERAGRWLKLVSGLVMLGLAILLLLWPEQLR